MKLQVFIIRHYWPLTTLYVSIIKIYVVFNAVKIELTEYYAFSESLKNALVILKLF